MPRPFAFLLVVALCAGAACGKYASKDAKPEPPGNASVGAGIEEATGTPSTTVGATGGSTPRTIVVGPTSTTLPANVSEATTPEGFRLTLTVDGDLSYRPGEDITLRVTALNASSKPLQYDPNDLRNFVFRPPGSGSVAWSDGTCRAARVPRAVETRAQVLNPNEETSFVDVYPGPADNPNRDDCRVGNGVYVVFGFVTWCPDGGTDARGVCTESKTRQVSSRGVRITIG